MREEGRAISDLAVYDPGEAVAFVELITGALDHVVAGHTVDYVAIDGALEAGFTAWNVACLIALMICGVCEQAGQDPQQLWGRFAVKLAADGADF